MQKTGPEEENIQTNQSLLATERSRKENALEEVKQRPAPQHLPEGVDGGVLIIKLTQHCTHFTITHRKCHSLQSNFRKFICNHLQVAL